MMLLLALPAMAVETLPEQASGSTGLSHMAPIKAERTHSPPAPGLVVPWAPDTESYILEYRQAPMDDPLEIPGPVVLHVPLGYAGAEKLLGLFNGKSLMLLAVYPSFGPRTPAKDRCGEAWCGDEISAAIQLAKDTPRRTHTGSVQSEVEASSLAENGATIFQTLKAPSGYEEAFTASRAATPHQLRFYTEFLVYRDERGEQQLGRCSLERANPTCFFHSFDPKTHILMLYDFPMTLLPQRQTIEDGLHLLVGGWQERGR